MEKSKILKKYLDIQEVLSPIQYNIFKILRKTGPTTRRELVKKLKIPSTTIYDNLVKLRKRKLIEKFSRNSGTRGRPLIFWDVC